MVACGTTSGGVVLSLCAACRSSTRVRDARRNLTLTCGISSATHCSRPAGVVSPEGSLEVSDASPLYVSFETVVHKRNMQTMVRYEDLPEEPGLAHALDVHGTREGDPWRKYGGAG